MSRTLPFAYKLCQAFADGAKFEIWIKQGYLNDPMNTSRLRWRFAISILCPLLIALIGYGDFREGDENSMLLLYLIPIGIGTWLNGVMFGTLMVGLSLTADVVSDKMAGVVSAGIPNLVTSFLYDMVFVVLLSRWHNLMNNMHVLVDEKTADLHREIARRKQLEREVANVTEHERRRLGQELHDSLCQHLAGTALQAQAVVKQVQAADKRAVENAHNIVTLVNRGIEIARDIARGLFSHELEGDGLITALQVLAETTSQQHELFCSFHHSLDVMMSPQRATQLYWIAREAVTNAVEHGNPKRIKIELKRAGQRVQLSVQDDGSGIIHSSGERTGIGLQVMKQRAELAGGALEISRRPAGGTAIQCEILLLC